jgi:glycosyltransferase involved in cell wall biosynthesis
VVPSTCFEGAPRSILEAYAAGVPVIASRIGGLPELVDEGRTGLLVAPGETAKWAEAITRLADDDLAIEMGDLAYGVWESDFGPDRGLRNLEEAYRAVMSKPVRSVVDGTRVAL